MLDGLDNEYWKYKNLNWYSWPEFTSKNTEGTLNQKFRTNIMRTNVEIKKISELNPGDICFHSTQGEMILSIVAIDDDEKVLLHLPLSEQPTFEDVSGSEYLLSLPGAKFEAIAQGDNVKEVVSPNIGDFALTEFGPILTIKQNHSTRKLYFNINQGKITIPNPKAFFVLSNWKIIQNIDGIDMEVSFFVSTPD